MVYSSQVGQLARHVWSQTLRDTAKIHLTAAKDFPAQIVTLEDDGIDHTVSSPVGDIAKNSLAWGSNFQVFRRYDLNQIGSDQTLLEHNVLEHRVLDHSVLEHRVLKYIALGRSVLECVVLEHLLLENIGLEYTGLEKIRVEPRG